ncbi:protein kinase domain containing protein isoform X3 [Zea mays]|uniref:protein kinase domain containing protein isoform X3 n=1 Tax=Zea mays TaxID=4577 RepID=UPI0004DEB958|nr:protein kinase domain containing protein isoform X3 [Zea mays]|eukprot:XP_008672826.1 protein kinase domain containing protein isoform X3 [Zea mays]
MPLAAAAAAVAACPSPIGLTRSLCRIEAHPRRRRRFRLEANSSASTSAPAPTAADEGGGAGLCPVVRFDMADFTVADRVSVGLHGRSDEMIFEATVCDPSSELYGSTVVLRQLKSLQAKRRGRRALEVLKKLARRQMMYHSYALQVHGYIAPCNAVEEEDVPLVLVHGYHGSHSLRHWLQLSDWIPTLEATLALDEEQVRRVGDDSVGGPAVTRQLRLIRILMRDLLIGVNYLHSHGLAHTELRIENVHVSPIDKHVKGSEGISWGPNQQSFPLGDQVGILGNAADFQDNDLSSSTIASNNDRRKMMIAFDMRCVGFIMAKMVLRELMDPSTFFKFKSFLTKGNDPSCLREFLLPTLYQNSPSGNIGLQMLDRQWGAGWNLLALLLATKPEERISCVDALRHPFLCGPKWRINPSANLIRWGLGSTAVRMAEDYIYGRHQRRRLSYFVELMEVLNPSLRTQNWLHLLPGRWRLLYCTGRHIGLTLRQPSPRVLISAVYLTVSSESVDQVFSLTSDVGFRIMPEPNWPHDKSGSEGVLSVTASARIAAGRIYINEHDSKEDMVTSSMRYLHGNKWRKFSQIKELPSSLPAVNIAMDEIHVSISCTSTMTVNSAQKALKEIRTQTPPEMFDLSKIVCGTYIDARLMILRGVNGSALLFTRANPMIDT